jgi:hypothetical protein
MPDLMLSGVKREKVSIGCSPIQWPSQEAVNRVNKIEHEMALADQAASTDEGETGEDSVKPQPLRRSVRLEKLRKS